MLGESRSRLSPTQALNLTPTDSLDNPTEDISIEDSLEYYYSDIMNNPVDQKYLSLITDQHISETEYKNLQKRYEEIWRGEYNKVI